MIPPWLIYAAGAAIVLVLLLAAFLAWQADAALDPWDRDQ